MSTGVGFEKKDVNGDVNSGQLLMHKAAKASSTSPCADLRIAYHNCFNRWYSEKFLKGKWDEEACVVEWKKYRDCLSEHLEDKHLSRFLEAESLFYLSEQTDFKKSVGDAS